MEDLTGMRLGQYQVLAPLGEGGMAAVYKAYQPSVDRQVALKILPRHFASDPEFTGRFEQEAKLIAKLQHVHILPVYDFGEAEGYTYIAMPFIETGTLADLMHGQSMPPDQVREIITQVGEALAYAHERGLVHRDVKPSNILIDHAGNCLLTDFGIAKIVEGTTKFTQTGAILGTPAYMSPEQIRGDKLDGRSDQYSLGIVLYEMVTGRPPFRAETPPAIIQFFAQVCQQVIANIPATVLKQGNQVPGQAFLEHPLHHLIYDRLNQVGHQGVIQIGLHPAAQAVVHLRAVIEFGHL